ncbi:MAG: arginase, partial [Desulfobacterales bacterium]|nr:arginase [Desulfobacterales bacterium]
MKGLNPKPQVELIGFPMDLGADRRGVDMGPSALRIAGITEKLTALGYAVQDTGDIPVRIQEEQRVKDPHLKYVDEIVRTAEVLAGRVNNSLATGSFPLCIGGDHSMALGTIAGIADYCRARDLTMGVIWLDAHADMNTDETSPSGNIHGMPLAASLGIGSPKLTHLLGFAPKVQPQNCALLAARQIDSSEKENIKKAGLPVYTMTDIDRRGIGAVIDQILADLLPDIDHLHVSFDLDCVDPRVVRGVGTPVPGGLTYREAHL